MIIVTKVISNDRITIGYQNHPENVIVQGKNNSYEVKIFAGYEGLKDLFDAFAESFNEDIDFKIACDFFRPSDRKFEVVNK